MTILALVSSGRSLLESSAPTNDDRPLAPAPPICSIGGRAAAGAGLEVGRADRHDLDLVARLHGRHGVAGIDRPHEGIGRDDLDGLGDLRHVEQGRDARGDVLADRIGRHHDVAVVRRQLDDERRDVLGQPVGVGRVLGLQHLGDAGDGGRRLGGFAGIAAGHQHVHVRAHLGRGGDGVGDVGADGLAVVRGDNEDGHDQITPASLRSLSTSSATVFTLMPDLRLGGSSTFSVLRRGATSTPSASGASTSIGFFLAFMMLGSEA